LMDTDIKKPKYADLQHIPLSFWISYYNDYIEDPEPLTLLINPKTMTSAFTKKINPVFSRQGFVVEEWGEFQDTIKFSGTIGGYYVFKSESEATKKTSKPIIEYSGLNRYNRRKSLSFQDIISILTIYRNNGAIYQRTSKIKGQPTSTKLIKDKKFNINIRSPQILEQAKNRISILGDVYMYYDRTIYLGAFDDFSITESTEKPYSLDYNISFSVRYRMTSDSRTYQYYNQIIVESGDISKNPSGTQQVIKDKLSIATKSTILEQFYTAPDELKSSTLAGLPDKLANYSLEVLDAAGYKVNKIKDLQSFKTIYKDMVINSDYKNRTEANNDLTKEVTAIGNRSEIAVEKSIPQATALFNKAELEINKAQGL